MSQFVIPIKKNFVKDDEEHTYLGAILGVNSMLAEINDQIITNCVPSNLRKSVRIYFALNERQESEAIAVPISKCIIAKVKYVMDIKKTYDSIMKAINEALNTNRKLEFHISGKYNDEDKFSRSMNDWDLSNQGKRSAIDIIVSYLKSNGWKPYVSWINDHEFDNRKVEDKTEIIITCDFTE